MAFLCLPTWTVNHSLAAVSTLFTSSDNLHISALLIEYLVYVSYELWVAMTDLHWNPMGEI